MSTENGFNPAVEDAYYRKRESGIQEALNQHMQRHIFEAISVERLHQDNKHGSPSTNPHEKGTWTLLIEAELNEAKVALIKGGIGRDSWASELIQIAALCVAALEQHGLERNGNGREL